MKLGDLLCTLLEKPSAVPAADREVIDISHDSRKVKPGSLFVAVRGFNSDGHQFVSQAVEQGAVGVVAEHKSGAAESVPEIIVEDSRRALALLANRFYGYPSTKLSLVGVTGTNGKTTTTYLVKSIVQAAGRLAALIGTIDYRIGDTVYPSPNTTPESLELQRFLSEAVGLGAEYCVMEVSSHALELGRTRGCEFAVAAFTNLTQDHLDFHGSMESYFQAKLRLFTGLSSKGRAVVNLDDKRAAEIINASRASVLTTGMTDRADVHPDGGIQHGIEGLRFNASTPIGMLPVQSPLVGRHNVYNVLTAIGIGIALGFPADAIALGIRAMKAVPGRMEKVDEGQGFGVVVDYAHTEDALQRLLQAAREITASRIITVFGCGGDRDRTKRPKMGAAALKGSDIVIVTSDNPRSEDAMSIIREIEVGMANDMKAASTGHAAKHREKPYFVIADRRGAIAEAVRIAKPGDVVVLAGKGHEDYQIIGSSKLHFDDREVAREEIRKRQEN